MTNHRRLLLMLRDNAGCHGNGHAPALNVSNCSSSMASMNDVLHDLPSVCSEPAVQPLHSMKHQKAGVTTFSAIQAVIPDN